MPTEKLIILGSGPAGYTAAIYAARAELKPLMIEGLQSGGQLMWTTEVENFPGFPEGVMGPELMERMKKQSERFGTRFVAGNATEADLSVRPFVVKTEEGEFSADSLIVATGASAMWLNIPGEEKYKSHGVSACATCDGFFFKNKRVAIVGGGDAAMEEAVFLTKFAEKVIVLVRKDELKASKPMQERAMKNEKIEFLWNSEAREVLGDGQKMTGLKVFNNKANEESEFPADGLFVAIGHKPNTGIFKDQLELDHKGYIILQPGSSATSIEGVFAAGDVADHKYRQAITAAGSGCRAALDAEKWLAEKE